MAFALLRQNRNYRFLFSASAISNLGDGISALAFPWLATLISRDPTHIALVAFATRLPWFLFSIPAGVITDRVDRQRLMVQADIFRLLLTMMIIGLILSGPTLPITEGNVMPYILALSGMGFLLGAAEVLRDNAAQTALPSIVAKTDLETANGQMWSIEQVMGAFIGPPLAGMLIAFAIPTPFVVDAVTFGLAAWLVWCIAMPPDLNKRRKQHFWLEMREGINWLWSHRLLLKIAVMLSLLNMLYTASFTILVLLSQEILGLTAVGYGLLLMAGAAGGVIGGLTCPALIRQISGTQSLIASLVLFVVGYLLIALATPATVALGLFIEAFGAMLWNVVTVSYRQRIIPIQLLGRVNSLYRFFGSGMMPLGALIGGYTVAWLEPSFGREIALRAPFCLAALGMFASLIYAMFFLRFPKDA